jgi:hypothetical protein
MPLLRQRTATDHRQGKSTPRWDINLKEEMEIVRARCPALGPTIYSIPTHSIR